MKPKAPIPPKPKMSDEERKEQMTKTFSSIENVASQGQLMVGMGIISQEENVMIGN